jgi:hypothetical protein
MYIVLLVLDYLQLLYLRVIKLYSNEYIMCTSQKNIVQKYCWL